MATQTLHGCSFAQNTYANSSFKTDKESQYKTVRLSFILARSGRNLNLFA